jgi:hypothetical protein
VREIAQRMNGRDLSLNVPMSEDHNDNSYGSHGFLGGRTG